MNDMMKHSIKQIKVLTPLPVFPVSHSRLSRTRILPWVISVGISDTIIGTTSTILNVFNDASNAIPVPFVHPLVASVASLLTAVQVSFRILVFVTLRANGCQKTRSNHGDMRQISAVAGKFVVMLAETCG